MRFAGSRFSFQLAYNVTVQFRVKKLNKLTMQTKLTIPGSIPLWQNKIWSIEKISKTEIAITNGNNVCYAYLGKYSDTIVVDRKIYPKYIEKKAIELAAKHITTIYK